MQIDKKGIPEEAITEFDLKFEEECSQGAHQDDGEPGNDPRSPYYWEHQLATVVERLLAYALGVTSSPQ